MECDLEWQKIGNLSGCHISKAMHVINEIQKAQ